MWLHVQISDVCLLVGCLTSPQQASVSQGRICSDNFTCCHTEIEVADQTFYPTQSQYTDTAPTSPSADPITLGAWQGSHRSANFEVSVMTRPRKKSRCKRDSNPGPSALEVDALPLGQRGGHKCLSRSLPEIHKPVAGTSSNQPTPPPQCRPSVSAVCSLTASVMMLLKGESACSSW